MPLLNPFRTGILRKLDNEMKTTKKCNFKGFYLKSQGEFRVKTNIFIKFIQFCYKQSCFLHAVRTWVHGRPLRPLQRLVPLLAVRRAQRVNDEPVKESNLLNFPISFRNEEKLSKNCIFYFWTKAMLLLNPLGTGIL